MNDLRRSPTVAVVMVALFALIQFVVPLTRIGDHGRAQRFGWQMFTTLEPPPEFVLITDDDEIEIVLSDYMAQVRADIDIVGLLPGHLCEVIPEARSVIWQSGQFTC